MIMNVVRTYMLRLSPIIINLMCIVLHVQAYERIVSWDSDVTIHQDSSMRVIERLTVVAEGHQIKHGLLREFPTNYKGFWGLRYNVVTRRSL